MISLIVVAAVASWMITGLVRRYSIAKAVLDIPNERSSHIVPTPRGGGLALALVIIGGVATLGFLGLAPVRLVFALCFGGTIVAGAGWIDDRAELSIHARFSAHLVAAIVAVVLLGGMPTLGLGITTLALGWAGHVLAVIAIVWVTNLYNFMDGIDGLAISQATIVATAAGALYLVQGHADQARISLLVAGACCGFLAWNWAPARIFMGDVGSGMLGFVFGVLAIAAERSDALPALCWVLLLGVFIFDSTVTLVRRAIHRERWWSSHRSHAYQRLVIAGRDHSTVAVLLVGSTLVLAGAAFIVVAWPSVVLPVLLIAVAGLAAGYVLVERQQPMTFVSRLAGVMNLPKSQSDDRGLTMPSGSE